MAGRRRIWLIIGTGVAVAAIVAALASQRHLIGYLQHVRPGTTAALIAIVLLFHVSNGILLRAVASKFGVVLTTGEWFGLPFVTAMGNYITPFAGGMLARASYLKLRHSFPYAKFVSVIAATYLIYGWVAGVAGIAAAALTAQEPGPSEELIFFFAVMLLILSACFLVPAFRFPEANSLIRFLNSAFEGWILIRRDLPLLLRFVLYTLATILLGGIAFWLAFGALSESPVPFGAPFIISIFSGLSIFIRVTPGNLGVSEAITTLASELLGMGAGIGFMASLLVRAASLIPIFTLGPLFSILLARELRENKP
jgi:uncharacterized membrane protein YbhN (UPF0104 family)